MAIVSSVARGVGRVAGWTAATAVSVGESVFEQLGDAGPVLADAYTEAYDERKSYLDMSPEERKAQRAKAQAALKAKRESAAPKTSRAKAAA